MYAYGTLSKLKSRFMPFHLTYNPYVLVSFQGRSVRQRASPIVAPVSRPT
jgi:hypothetical protein